ncbi:MAG TPA: polymer-forming cytoskeletal protein [Flavisolibacter sp.]|nr:polymer-forming cytoskeletal protein [Flavisolibacter sp.]
MNPLDHMFSSAYWKGAFWVPEDTHVLGPVKAGSTACIEGRVDGSLHAKGKLVIRKNAVVNGDAEAQQVVVYGIVHGNVKAHKAVIARTARIRGRVDAAFVDIEKGALVEGLEDGEPLPAQPELPAGAVKPGMIVEEDAGTGQWF